MSHFKNVNVAYVYVKDWEAAKKFYAETLEWPVAYSDDGLGWVEYGVDGATHFAISRWDDIDTQPARGLGTTVTFSVEDAEAVTKALRLRGVRCDDPVVVPGVVTFGTFYDLEGNRLQFASSNA